MIDLSKLTSFVQALHTVRSESLASFLLAIIYYFVMFMAVII